MNDHDDDCATQCGFHGENSDVTTHPCTCKQANQFKCNDCLDSGVVPIGEEQGQILYSECPTCKTPNPMKIVATEQMVVQKEIIIMTILGEFLKELTDRKRHYLELLSDYAKRINNLNDQPDTIDEDIQEFVNDINHMRGLYQNKRYGLAEEWRDKLAERLDDIMRLSTHNKQG